jgi:hypothetical protein
VAGPDHRDAMACGHNRKQLTFSAGPKSPETGLILKTSFRLGKKKLLFLNEKLLF